MPKLEVYDPPMCCSTGVCGPSVDKILVRFAADLDWLKRRGLYVERFNLSQRPDAFVKNPVVKEAMDSDGSSCLPLAVVDGREVARGRYPSREELAEYLGLVGAKDRSLWTATVAELVAVGAAIASNCKPCLKYHYDKARELGVTDEDIACAVDTAQRVKAVASSQIADLADRYLDRREAEGARGRCGGARLAPGVR